MLKMLKVTCKKYSNELYYPIEVIGKTKGAI